MQKFELKYSDFENYLLCKKKKLLFISTFYIESKFSNK